MQVYGSASAYGYAGRDAYAQKTESLGNQFHAMQNNMAGKAKKGNAPGAAGNKTMQLVEQLNKHKENITKQKNELVERTLEQGADLEQIEEALEYYDEQILRIDEEVSNLLADQAKVQAEQLGRKEEEKDKASAQNAEEDELGGGQLAALAAKMERGGVLMRTQHGIENGANVRTSQLKKDDLGMEYRQSKAKIRKAQGKDVSNAEKQFMRQTRAQYKAEMRQVQKEAQEAMAEVAELAGETLSEVNEELKNGHTRPATATQEEQAQERREAAE